MTDVCAYKFNKGAWERAEVLASAKTTTHSVVLPSHSHKICAIPLQEVTYYADSEGYCKIAEQAPDFIRCEYCGRDVYATREECPGCGAGLRRFA